MRRNTQFATRQPLRSHDQLTLHHATGALPILNPTRAHFTYAPQSRSGGVGKDSAPVRFLWRSRDNRKGRHQLVINPEHSAVVAPRSSSHPTSIAAQIVWRTFTCFPVWDISWLVAFIFTWGSVVWVINVSCKHSACQVTY